MSEIEASSDSPVTVTLPRRVMKRVLDSVREHAYKLSRRDDQIGLKALSDASEVIGDAVDAPLSRRFRMPEKLHHGVIAGDRVEYDRWLASAVRGREYRDDPVFLDSVDDVFKHVYSDYTSTGTAYRRDDFQELMAALRTRVFPRGER